MNFKNVYNLKAILFLQKAENFMLLTEPKKSRIVAPNIEVVDIKKKSNDGKQFEITLSAKAVAPFVVLDFKLGSGISGQFLENGFFIFNGKRSVEFETKQNLNEKQIKDNLIFKTLTDIV